jgi:hypothetical protein
MALVATVTGVTTISDQAGTKKRALGTVAFDNKYQTNGMSIINSQIGLTTVDMLFVYPSAGYVFEYISSTKKIKAYWVPTGTNAAAAVLGEVALNTDMSALTAVPFEAFGS